MGFSSAVWVMSSSCYIVAAWWLAGRGSFTVPTTTFISFSVLLSFFFWVFVNLVYDLQPWAPVGAVGMYDTASTSSPSLSNGATLCQPTLSASGHRKVST
jgi:hypothetical protein